MARLRRERRRIRERNSRVVARPADTPPRARRRGRASREVPLGGLGRGPRFRDAAPPVEAARAEAPLPGRRPSRCVETSRGTRSRASALRGFARARRGGQSRCRDRHVFGVGSGPVRNDVAADLPRLRRRARGGPRLAVVRLGGDRAGGRVRQPRRDRRRDRRGGAPRERFANVVVSLPGDGGAATRAGAGSRAGPARVARGVGVRCRRFRGRALHDARRGTRGRRARVFPAAGPVS